MILIASRIVWLAAAGAWAIRGLVALTEPSYWDPGTTLDLVAVWSYSAALVLLAPALLLIARLTPTRPVMNAAAVVAGGVIVAGSANALEDGFAMKALGTVYVAGILTAWPVIVALAVAQHRAGFSRLAALSGALFGGIALASLGGGVIVAASLATLAAAPRWFLRAAPARPPGPTAEPETHPS